MLVLMLSVILFSDNFHHDEIAWRNDREASMKSDDSWLNLVGLFWLHEGENPFGTDQDLDIVFPLHATVSKAGTFIYEDGKVRFEMNRGQRAEVDGVGMNQGVLEKGQVFAHNHLRMFLIERGDRLALRVRDLRSKTFLHFQALDFYRPKKKYVVEATFEPYPEPRTLTITTVINTEIELVVPGVIKFELDGKSFELLPTQESEEDETFFIMFKDQTSGTTTYRGGRFLYAPKPVDGKLTLNFNRAINPPCAYTDFATCPLPPADNWLEIPIEAGEKVYEYHHEEL